MPNNLTARCPTCKLLLTDAASPSPIASTKRTLFRSRKMCSCSSSTKWSWRCSKFKATSTSPRVSYARSASSVIIITILVESICPALKGTKLLRRVSLFASVSVLLTCRCYFCTSSKLRNGHATAHQISYKLWLKIIMLTALLKCKLLWTTS